MSPDQIEMYVIAIDDLRYNLNQNPDTFKLWGRLTTLRNRVAEGKVTTKRFHEVYSRFHHRVNATLGGTISK